MERRAPVWRHGATFLIWVFGDLPNMGRSLASADCVIAARCREPSGFLTTLIGDMAMEAFVCPRRNKGSCSFSSISSSSSVFSTFISPASSSNCG